jgi:hypothetical protein
VQCPYCTKIHCHGFGQSYSCISRLPHCGHEQATRYPSYHFSYPFSTTEGTVAYEIDKYAGFYVAFEAKAQEAKVQPLEEALDKLDLDEGESQKSRKWSEATEEIILGLDDDAFRRLHGVFGGEDTMQMKKIEHVSQMLISGNVKYVQEYIITSPEASIFLHGVDKDGKSAMSMAACETHSDMIKMLLEHGAHSDHQDAYGRTALMEAAFWGRIENVNHLLQYGADAKLRDSEGHRAIDLATSSERNDEERWERSGGDTPGYREDTYIANRARRVIVSLLKPLTEAPAAKAQPTHDPTFITHSFKSTSHGTIELHAPIAEFHVPNTQKTIASLQRPPPFPAVAAMSGWNHDETDVTVSGKQWTDEVMRIALIVGHELPREGLRDQGRTGKYYATHAEKQLVAYFIDKHILMEEDDSALREVEPPVEMKRAVVLVSRPPCGDCICFIRTVNRALGLNIEVLDRSHRAGSIT